MQTSRASITLSDRCGAIAVFAVLAIVLVIAFSGLALDYAFVGKSTQELQAASDAGALAGARIVTEDIFDPNFLTTRQAVTNVVASNEVANTSLVIDPNATNVPTGDVVVGVWDAPNKTFIPVPFGPNAVQVTGRRTDASSGGPLGLQFGSLFGTATSQAARTAIARAGGGGAAVVLILHPNLQGSFEMKGTPELAAPNNRIQVNSTHNCALKLNGAPDDPRVVAGSIDIVGAGCVPSGSCVPVPLTGVPVVPDPLAGLPYPDTSTMVDHGGITSSGTYDPGYYPNGVNFNGGQAFLNPGVYVFGPPGIEVNGSAQILGEEVMLFIDMGGRVVVAGNDAGLDIGAPTSGTYQGISIFQHRGNPMACDISGTGLFDVRGTMYFATGHLEMDGTVDRRIGRIIVYTQLLRGTGRYIITGDGLVSTGLDNPILVK